MLVYNVWLPADTPDSLYINIGLQTKDFWQDASTRYYAKDIPKEVWYPIYANIKQLDIKQTNFNPATQDFGWFYVEVGSWLLKGNDLNWNGKLYFDNVGFLSSAVGDKWVIADFESASDPIGKFVVPSASLTLSNLQRVANTQGSGFVMQADADFSKGSIGQIEKSDVKIFNQATDGTKDTADAITLDVFLPADMPKDVIGIQFVYQPAGGSWPWCQKDYIVSDSSLVPGKWNTLVWKVADFASQLTDYTLPGNVFVQLYASPGPSYSGKILFDNLTLQGIKEPAGTVLPVSLTSCVADTAMLNPTNKVIDYVRLDWVDNTLQTCTYNIYMSEKPITSSTPSTASGVVKVAPDIPQGLQKYAIRPYSHDGGVKNYYFAVTSNGKGSETVLQAKSKKGPIAVNTTPTFKIQYVSDFASKFVLDGMDDEFADYKTNQIVPETVNGRPDGWTPESPDVSFKLTLVIDDNYLYISADVSDDDVNTDASMQAWQGDALEFFMGFYDVRYLSAWHTKNFANANGDWRFAFTSRGTTALDGGTDVTIPGIEATNYVKFGGDGYIVEGRINLATLAGKEIKVTDGMLFPFRVDCNDHDATKNDNGRGSQCGIGGCPTATAAKIDLNEDWKRPHGWGFAEVIGAPVGVNEADNNLPKEFKLYSNYPNPFNPATSIKYDLPKSTRVVVKVYDIVGREIATLVDADQKAGYYETKFNAANLASGIYFYRITTPEFTLTKKMMLMK
jgi:hypothetical protein